MICLSSCHLSFHLQDDRAVVRSEDLVLMLASDDLITEPLINHHIVNPSADITRSSSCSITSSCVCVECLRMEVSSHIQTCRLLHKSSDFCSLDRQETNSILIFLRSGNINRCVDDIKIACRDRKKSRLMLLSDIIDNCIIKT